MKNLIDELLKLENNELLLEGKKYTAPNKDSYTILDDVKDDVNSIKEPIIAIDGGSTTLLETPSFCIGFVRIVSVKFTDQKIINKQEGYMFSIIKNEKFFTKFYDDKTKKIIELFEISIDELESLNAANNLGRKLLEWQFIEELTHSDSEANILWDGSFTPQTKIEEEFVKRLIGKNILGLAKSTTANYYSFFKNAPQKIWSIKIKDQLFETYFIKLHNKGKIFRIDKLGNFDFDKLIPWSSDPVFFGYPYPLILADQLARISNQETEALKIRLQVIAGKDWAYLIANALDSHSILDKIQF